MSFDALYDLPVSELRKTEEGLALLREAVTQTALAYYYKKKYTQYEKASVTVMDNIYFAPKYRHCDVSPEYAEWDTRYLDLCRGFTHNVYHDAFQDENGKGLQTFGGNEIGFNSYHVGKGAVLQTGSYPMFHDDNEPRLYDTYVEDGLTHEQAVDRMKAMLVAGDIIDGDGHILLCIGDALGEGRNDLLHCWPTNGGCIVPETGEPKFEPVGAITCQSMDAVLFSRQPAKGIPRWGMYSDEDKYNDFGIHRPYMDKMYDGYHLSPSAVTRVKFRGISLSKTADRSVYSHVAEGELFTLTETVTNHGKDDFRDLLLTEFVPEGTKLLAAEGADVQGSKLTWRLTVPAGKAVTVTVKLQNEKKAGDAIAVLHGSCGDETHAIPTRDLLLKVGKMQYSEAQLARFEQSAYDLAAHPELLEFAELKQVKRFFAYAFGFTPSLPDFLREFMAQTLQKQKIVCDEEGNTQEMLVPAERTAANATLLAQIPHLLLSGRYVHLGRDLASRIAEYREEYFTPGDVIVTYGGKESQNTTELLDDSDLRICIYLGENRVVQFSRERNGMALFSATVARAYNCNYFVTIRPSMAEGK